MRTCEFEHEGKCALEAITNHNYRKHPCEFARYDENSRILRNCTVTEDDLKEFEDAD